MARRSKAANAGTPDPLQSEWSGEYARLGEAYGTMPFDPGEYDKRMANMKALRPQDRYYRNSRGNLCKVENAPFVNGPQWEFLQKYAK